MKTDARQAFYDQLPLDFNQKTFLNLAGVTQDTTTVAERYVQTFYKEGKLYERSLVNAINHNDKPRHHGGAYFYNNHIFHKNKITKFAKSKFPLKFVACFNELLCSRLSGTNHIME